MPHSFVVLVDECFIALREQFLGNEVLVVRTESKVFEPVEVILFAHQQNILDSYSVLSWLVVPWLVSDNHACLKFSLVVFAYSHWPLVHSLEVSNPVSSAMCIIKALSP